MAWRVFSGDSVDTIKAALQSELDHTFAVLEGRAAIIWSLIATATTRDALAGHCLANEWDTNELDAFLSELRDSRYIDDGACGYQLPDATPTPRRLEFAENTVEESELMLWAAERGFLWSAQWEMTYRCNERCVHCYNPGAAHSPGEQSARDRDELSLEEAKTLLQDLAKIGVFRLILSGGEITLRKDLVDVIRYARSLGFSVALYTNGLQLRPSLIDTLSEFYPTSISISIYSADPLKHDAVTGVPGSYRRSLEAARRVRDRNIKLYIKCPLMAATADGYKNVIDLADSLGAAPEIDMNLSDGADGVPVVANIGVTDARFVLLLALTPGSPLYVGTEEEDFGRVSKDPTATVCGAGTGILYIDPEGTVSSCSGLPSRSVNIRSRSLAETWAETPVGARRSGRPPSLGLDIARWQNKSLSKYTECGTHLRCSWCSKCPSMAFLEHGDENRPSALNCFHAGARMMAAKWLSAGMGLPGVRDLLYSLPAELAIAPRMTNLVQITISTSDQSSIHFESYSAITPGLELNSGSPQTVQFLATLDKISERILAH
jgi:MoaA/NifB/PqqE/SkfB family radical SAM enzyme